MIPSGNRGRLPARPCWPGAPTMAEQERSRSELSLSQEQIWLDDQINPGTAVYNIPIALHFRDRWTQTSWSAA